MPETSPVLWALAYRSKMIDKDCGTPLAANAEGCPPKRMELFRSVGCVGSRITSELFTLKFKHAKRVVRNGKKDTTTSPPLCWTAGAGTVVSDQDQDPIRIWILTCRWFLTVGICQEVGGLIAELGRGGWWFRDPVENASFMPRVLATARTFSIRSGLLAPVHSFATDDTRGIFLWRFFLLMTGISMILFSQMKQQASVRRTYKKEMVVARSTLVHLRHSARAQKGRKEGAHAELDREKEGSCQVGPLTPYLPIYKPQPTSTFPISHRGTASCVCGRCLQTNGGRRRGRIGRHQIVKYQSWKRFDSSLMLLSQERKAHARNES
ncbi:hypothetical protein HAX54_029615 [Datura stramonium]|uniref:Cytochrome c biogenesis ccmF n=1 Tax=Datura stramonium TaxID=4076 RepID=A0ABS8V6W7_DATST|nr:hypothetical protein [Datura stramonium]